MQKNIKKKVDLSGEKNIPTHVVAVFGIVQKGSKYLIAKRSSSDPQAGGTWSVPSGKVEIGEGIGILEETLKREIAEEVGIKIKDRITLISNGAFTRVSGHNVIALTFLCYWKSGEAKPLEDQEEVKWMKLQELLKFEDLPSWEKERIESLRSFLSSNRKK